MCQKVTVYTDGSCWNGNYTDQTRSSSSVSIMLDEDLSLIDYVVSTSNHGTSNVAEINAILGAIEHLIMLGVFEVDIYTDSKYSIKLFTNDNYYDKNRFFHEKYVFLAKMIKVNLYHVDRDSKNHYNQFVDKVAGIVRKNMDKFLNENVNYPVK
jgi:ribonuclease HI